MVDACSLYNALHRDLLISLALEGGFRMILSETIVAELAATRCRLVREQTGVSERVKTERMIAGLTSALTLRSAGEVVPDSDLRRHVEGLSSLGKDAHVLAACIVADANTLLTENVSDFPAEETEPLRVTVLSIGSFLHSLLPGLLDEQLRAAITGMGDRRSRPRPWTLEEMLGEIGRGPGASQKIREWVARVSERLIVQPADAPTEPGVAFFKERFREPDPQHPRSEFTVTLHFDHPGIEQMRSELYDRLIALPEIIDVELPARLITPETSPDEAVHCIEGRIFFVPLYELPADDPAFQRVKDALTPQWALSGHLIGFGVPENPAATMTKGVIRQRQEAAESALQEWLDRRARDLTAIQRERVESLCRGFVMVSIEMSERPGSRNPADEGWNAWMNWVGSELQDQGLLGPFDFDDLWGIAGL